jgi:hypothetical protein
MEEASPSSKAVDPSITPVADGRVRMQETSAASSLASSLNSSALTPASSPTTDNNENTNTNTNTALSSFSALHTTQKNAPAEEKKKVVPRLSARTMSRPTVSGKILGNYPVDGVLRRRVCCSALNITVPCREFMSVSSTSDEQLESKKKAAVTSVLQLGGVVDALQATVSSGSQWSQRDVEMLRLVVRGCLFESMVEIFECVESSNAAWTEAIRPLLEASAQVICSVRGMVPDVTESLASSMMEFCESVRVVDAYGVFLDALKTRDCLGEREMEDCMCHVNKYWSPDEIQKKMLACLEKRLAEK